ncbi:MAG: GGDEF domain-containing protein [Candidatus Omnitrophota bacterium]|nr:GGDEF domain-containing protein [Candidatus Omnitrophota bacterium]MDZ4243473.1 GGDEF domain-containing protein [Candidatus Omnitrophota bacterium]
MKKYETIFEHSPVAILVLDYSPLAALGRQLQAQTVTNIRQYLLEHIDVVKRTYRNIRVLETNRAALQLFGAGNKRELYTGLVKTFSTMAIDILVEQFVALLEGDREFAGEFKCKSAKGKFQDVFLKVSIPGKTGGFQKVIAALQDITIWKRLERELRKRAQLDGLTRLLNHNTIMQRLEEELIRSKRYGLSLSCMMIDLDHFKVINDKFGHPRGDQVLKHVAVMIKNCVRKVDIVGRYGGDEFLIVLPETKSRNARYAAMRIQNMFANKMFRYQRLISFRIALSIGISGYPSRKVKASKDLVALADKAMYDAKKSGRNRIAVV